MSNDGDELAKTASAAPPSSDAGDSEELAKTAAARPSANRLRDAGPTPAKTLGRYRIERQLGAGGMGVVHAAFDPDLERRVALKVLRGGGSEEARQRLLREARAMARLNHPNVITVHEVSSRIGRSMRGFGVPVTRTPGSTDCGDDRRTQAV